MASSETKPDNPRQDSGGFQVEDLALLVDKERDTEMEDVSCDVWAVDLEKDKLRRLSLSEECDWSRLNLDEPPVTAVDNKGDDATHSRLSEIGGGSGLATSVKEADGDGALFVLGSMSDVGRTERRGALADVLAHIPRSRVSELRSKYELSLSSRALRRRDAVGDVTKGLPIARASQLMALVHRREVDRYGGQRRFATGDLSKALCESDYSHLECVEVYGKSMFSSVSTKNSSCCVYCNSHAFSGKIGDPSDRSTLPANPADAISENDENSPQSDMKSFQFPSQFNYRGRRNGVCYNHDVSRYLKNRMSDSQNAV